MAAGTNLFLQWATNLEGSILTDEEYAADTMRDGGAPDGHAIFPSDLGNKLFTQITTMTAALGQVIADYEHDANDASLNNLVTAIKATFARLNGDQNQAFSAANGTTGNQVINISQFAKYEAGNYGSPYWYQQLPTGMLVQGGYATTGTLVGNIATGSITFPWAFLNACYGVWPVPIGADWGTGSSKISTMVTGLSKNGFNIQFDHNDIPMGIQVPYCYLAVGR
jgi:hypothetical protein